MLAAPARTPAERTTPRREVVAIAAGVDVTTMKFGPLLWFRLPSSPVPGEQLGVGGVELHLAARATATTPAATIARRSAKGWCWPDRPTTAGSSARAARSATRPVGSPSMDRALAPFGMAGLDHNDPQAQQGEAHRREGDVEVGEHGLPLLVSADMLMVSRPPARHVCAPARSQPEVSRARFCGAGGMPSMARLKAR
jgi:hypothetical protein